MDTLSLKEVRKLILQQQGLSGQAQPKGVDQTRQQIQQIGYVQIDTISVIERAHHHILKSRIHDYHAGFLQQLEEDRSVFEYWAHAASYLPIENYRYSLPRKIDFQTGKEKWFKRDPKTLNYILDRLKAEGPLQSKDFKPATVKKNSNGMDWSRNPMNQALRQLFMQGHIMITARKGFQKVYDLTERVVPIHIDQSHPSQEEYLQHLILRDIQAHGVLKQREMGYLLKGTSKPIQQELAKMVEAGTLTPIFIEKQAQTQYYTTPELLDTLGELKIRKRLHILSPFDNLLIQRKRMEELFDFSYTLECYVPGPKRQVGYFALPLLYGDQFVGKIDLKADRKRKVLMIQNLVWEPNLKQQEKMESLLEKSLAKFAAFNACDGVA
ncbi:MAG: winged helix DNA-binding domain-containing protein [Saprospiraceae bacterium]|nr:winged helix DNA-binding domain-containing protein [Saprospiraceae bacterium]